MTLELLEIGEADQLSACKLSLLLGVFTPQNQVENFLKFSRGLLQAKSAILTFHYEPYIWYSSPEGLSAFHAKKEANLSAYFLGESTISHHHSKYHEFSQHIHDLGVGHRRIVGFDLKTNENVSIGQVILFDDVDDVFEQDKLNLVHDFAMTLIRIIELSADYATLKEEYEQQSALNFSKTKFFQIIAHDLRAPFHGMLGFSEVLAQERDTLDEKSLQNITDYLHDTTQSTYRLLENLLNWAMAEGGRFVYHPINFKLKQSSKIVNDVLQALAIRKNIQLVDELSDDLKVYADINMVTSVLQNLVSNALKFTHMDGTGKVTIQARQHENKVEISIADTGLGMSAKQIENLFQPQITFHLKGTAGEKGTGLGLVLCKRFIDLNHGEITVTSKEGEGTIFRVTLPMATNEHQTLTKKVSKNMIKNAAMGTVSNQKIS